MRGSGPIGIFDSGVGGLSVLAAIRSLLPDEDLLYVADSGHAPYGGRSPEWIAQRSLAIARHLVDGRAKAIVVACNTATTIAVAQLRAAWPQVPIVAIEPAVKPAVAISKTGCVAVMATAATLASAQFARLVQLHAGEAEVIACPCPGLADMVEAGAIDAAAVVPLLDSSLAHAALRPVDVVALGCTHYPFLRPAIAAWWGSHVAIVDPASAVAAELARRLAGMGLLREGEGQGAVSLQSSGDPVVAARVVSRLLGLEVDMQALPELALDA